MTRKIGSGGTWEQAVGYGRAVAAFGGIAPAATMVEVQALIDPRMLVEVEVEAVAYRPGIGRPRSGPPEAGEQ